MPAGGESTYFGLEDALSIVEQQRRPKPLLGAHGITGTANDMTYALGIARTIVPQIDTESVDTGAISSVWSNGATILVEAAQKSLQAGKPVEVIAHSKGGLDTRVAMWAAPSFFSDLGMLSTPNAGSKAADKLCFLRKHGGPLSNQQSQFGPCDDEEDGLFDLQTGYIRDVFNVEVRDWNFLNYWNVAGDCTGLFKFSCNFSANVLLGCDDRGGDTAVCVSSAFGQTRAEGSGTQQELDVFDADHTQMRSKPCPSARLLAEMYPFNGPSNPYIQSLDGTGCDDLRPVRASANRSARTLRNSRTRQPVAHEPHRRSEPSGECRDPPRGRVDAAAEVYVPSGVSALVQLLDDSAKTTRTPSSTAPTSSGRRCSWSIGPASPARTEPSAWPSIVQRRSAWFRTSRAQAARSPPPPRPRAPCKRRSTRR